MKVFLISVDHSSRISRRSSASSGIGQRDRRNLPTADRRSSGLGKNEGNSRKMRTHQTPKRFSLNLFLFIIMLKIVYLI